VKPNIDDMSTRHKLFDEVADAPVDDGLSRDEVREVAALLSRVVTASETDRACGRVRVRLFADRRVGSVRPRAVLPNWLAVAAVLAVFITGLALFSGSSTLSRNGLVAEEETALTFPGEAVLDSQLARLEIEMAAATDDGFWYSDSTLFEGSSR
jgi:hypothetical protein